MAVPSVKIPHLDIASELTAYRVACQQDQYLQSFHSTIEQRTGEVINTLKRDVKGPSIPLSSLKKLTDSFVKSNQQVAQHILKRQEEILNNDYLSHIVKDYFDNSSETLKFCNALEECLKSARDSQVTFGAALQQFKNEHSGVGSDEKRKIYSKTLQKLKNCKKAGNPFTQEFFLLLKSVYEKQKLLLETLTAKKSEFDEKLKNLNTDRKTKNVIFGVTIFGLLVSSVVVAVLAAPAAVPALAAAALELGAKGVTSSAVMSALASVAAEIGEPAMITVTALSSTAAGLEAMMLWTDSLWKKYEDELNEQRKIISSLENRTQTAMVELDNIRHTAEKLNGQIESMLKNADFALQDEDAVILAMDSINDELSKFRQTIKDLSKHTEDCSRHIMTARGEIKEMLLKYRNK